MSNKKQSISDVSSVDFIYNAFNLLSDADFKAWMLNTHDFIKAMHREEIKDAFYYGLIDDSMITDNPSEESELYYNQTFNK